MTAAYQKLQDASQQLTDTQEEVENILKDLGASEAERDLQVKLDELNAAIAAAELAAAEAEDALAALAGIESAQTVVETLQVELAAIRTSLERAKLSAQEIAAAAEKLVVPSINIEELEAARQEIQAAGIVYPPHCAHWPAAWTAAGVPSANCGNCWRRPGMP